VFCAFLYFLCPRTPPPPPPLPASSLGRSTPQTQVRFRFPFPLFRFLGLPGSAVSIFSLPSPCRLLPLLPRLFLTRWNSLPSHLERSPAFFFSPFPSLFIAGPAGRLFPPCPTCLSAKFLLIWMLKLLRDRLATLFFFPSGSLLDAFLPRRLLTASFTALSLSIIGRCYWHSREDMPRVFYPTLFKLPSLAPPLLLRSRPSLTTFLDPRRSKGIGSFPFFPPFFHLSLSSTSHFV